MTLEFQPWPKIARLNRDIVITEKLDGTNAAIVIVELTVGQLREVHENVVALVTTPHSQFAVYAQSRNKFITPGKSTDNYGFAGWVDRNAEALVLTLGEGTHFGEWWGSGIQRGYGFPGGVKRFSLFNTGRWEGNSFLAADGYPIPGLSVVPVLYSGPFAQYEIDNAVEALRIDGSAAAPGFDHPEGIVVYHTAARLSFKVTLEGDDATKATPRREHDLLPEEATA